MQVLTEEEIAAIDPGGFEMSVEVINEALELLRIAQNNMGPGRSSLDDEERAHWDRISKCRQGLEKLKQQEPVAWVEVIDRHEGPYNFHGKELLDSGKHLFSPPLFPPPRRVNGPC